MIENIGRLFINGEWVQSQGGIPLAVENPANEQEIATITLGTSKDVDRAVAAAKTAFSHFRDTSKTQRLGLLRKFREIYAARYEEMAWTISTEMGAPITLSREQQAETGLGHLDAFISAFEALEEKEILPNGDTVLLEPIGVCGLITPWNWPINQIALKVIPALATGCTCVLKPSELTPLSAKLYVEMLNQAGVPGGVVNLVQGDGPNVGTALVRHPDVDMISFTGSTRAGAEISQTAAPTGKRVTLELGGKSPCLVFGDADLHAAVDHVVSNCMNNTGQSCDAPTRLLVERSVYPAVVDMAAACAEKIHPGDPSREGSHIGPLVSAAQYERVQWCIETAISEGARLVAGGAGKPDGFEIGHFARPTVFSDVANYMTIAREEVFGPVLVIIPFDDEEEAITIANDTPYGLAAYFHTTNDARKTRLIRGLRAGMIHVNGAHYQYGSPFGGYRMSGNGREGGIWGLHDYLEIKAVHC